MDPDHISYREEQRAEQIIRARLAAAGMVDCPFCGNTVPEDSIERCRCGKQICAKCGMVSTIEGFEDELVCGPACEKKSLEVALKEITRQHAAEEAALQAKYDSDIQPIIKRLSELMLRAS